jgi:hypothetical protein
MVIIYLKHKLCSSSAGQWGDVLWLCFPDISSSQTRNVFLPLTFHLSDTHSRCITDQAFNTPKFGCEFYFGDTQFTSFALKFLYVNWDAIGNSCVSCSSSLCRSFVTSYGGDTVPLDYIGRFVAPDWFLPGLPLQQMIWGCHQRYSYLPI